MPPRIGRLGFLLYCLLPALASPAPCQNLVSVHRVLPDTDATSWPIAEPYSGSRIPLIFIHGINNKFSDGPIAQFAQTLAKDLKTQYDVFTIEYDFRRPIEANGRDLAERLSRMCGDHQFVLVGHSMGGLLARAALELHGHDYPPQDLMAQCARLITLGTPHHGTPYANDAWVDAVAGSHALLDLGNDFLADVRLLVGTDPLGASSQGVLDMAWDNFDHKTPLTALPGQPGVGADGAFLAALNLAFGNAVRSHPTDGPSRKYILYGGYSTYWETSLGGVLSVVNKLGSEEQSWMRVAYLFLGSLLAWAFKALPLYWDDTYTANDGIVPLTSSLYMIWPDDRAGLEPISHITNKLTGWISTIYDVSDPLQSAIDARKQVRKAEAVVCFHNDYPSNYGVIDQVEEDLQAPDLVALVPGSTPPAPAPQARPRVSLPPPLARAPAITVLVADDVAPVSAPALTVQVSDDSGAASEASAVTSSGLSAPALSVFMEEDAWSVASSPLAAMGGGLAAPALTVLRDDTVPFPELSLDLTSLPVTTQVSEDVRNGDLTGDGSVSVADVLKAIRITLRLVPAESGDLRAADFDNDGRIAISDVLALLRMVLGLT